jgi:hypothetical protein
MTKFGKGAYAANKIENVHGRAQFGFESSIVRSLRQESSGYPIHKSSQGTTADAAGRKGSDGWFGGDYNQVMSKELRKRPFQQVNVFSGLSCRGNPLAVVLDSTGLDTAAMQRLATWTNLSETAFLLPPTQRGAHYRVRIFTPSTELPFAGHPTLGSCHAWLHSGGGPVPADGIVQECGVGLIPIRRDGERLAFQAPPLIRTGLVEAARLDLLA